MCLYPKWDRWNYIPTKNASSLMSSWLLQFYDGCAYWLANCRHCSETLPQARDMGQPLIHHSSKSIGIHFETKNIVNCRNFNYLGRLLNTFLHDGKSCLHSTGSSFLPNQHQPHPNQHHPFWNILIIFRRHLRQLIMTSILDEIFSKCFDKFHILKLLSKCNIQTF